MVDLPELNPDDEEIEVEVVEHQPPLTDRSVARRIALQVLYEMDCTNHNLGDVMDARIQSQEVDSRTARYVARLATGITRMRTQLDAVLQEYAVDWPLESIAIVDRNVMRMALYEMAVIQTVTVATAIDEAVGLANLFGTDSAPAFVNGVLGKIALDIEDLRTQLVDDGEVSE
ncbi:MAG: transcription antitermination factor NusB [Anaerolineae bacterium]|nr:transcription antitermination factor NusB [Anaerolineae bacterium]